MGEYAALTCAGVFDFETGLRLIKAWDGWDGWDDHRWFFHESKEMTIIVLVTG